MYDILCLSDCCIDLIFQGLERIPHAGGEEYCKNFSLHAGGGANTPIALARLGCRTAYATTVGDDHLGAVVMDEMLSSGISREFIRQEKNTETWISAVLSTPEDRAFASYAGASADYTEAELEAMVKRTRWVHTYMYYCEKYPQLPDVCRRLGVPLSMDTAYDPSQSLESLAPLFDKAALITPNESEALGMTGETDTFRALKKLSSICPGVVITMGGEGCMAALDGGFYRVYAPKVELVDANGAGDLFNAGLLWARLKGFSTMEQLRLACAAGSVAVTCVGSMDERYNARAIGELSSTVRVDVMK